MSPSGLVYAVIVALWAAVLIPVWLRRHDDAAVTRSADRYSQAMRTLSRRPARIDRREMVMPARPVAAPLVDAPRAVPRHEVSSRVGGASRRGSARPASVRAASARLARRRTRSLLVLTGLTLVLAGLWAFGVVPVWAVLPTALLLVGFVVHLRLQARRAAARLRTRRQPEAAPVVAPTPSMDLSRAVVVETKGDTLGAAETEVVAGETVAGPATDAWRPEHWPLPTYVTKPKAIRPIRVIDLTTPGAWTSGRLLDDDVESAEQTVAEAHLAEKELDAIIEQAAPESSEQSAQQSGQHAAQHRRVVND